MRKKIKRRGGKNFEKTEGKETLKKKKRKRKTNTAG